MNTTDVEIEKRADAIFDALTDYEKWRLAQDGTTFTTYEIHGDDVCAALNRRARAWKCYQMATGGFNCRHEGLTQEQVDEIVWKMYGGDDSGDGN